MNRDIDAMPQRVKIGTFPIKPDLQILLFAYEDFDMACQVIQHSNPQGDFIVLRTLTPGVGLLVFWGPKRAEVGSVIRDVSPGNKTFDRRIFGMNRTVNQETFILSYQFDGEYTYYLDSAKDECEAGLSCVRQRNTDNSTQIRKSCRICLLIYLNGRDGYVTHIKPFKVHQSATGREGKGLYLCNSRALANFNLFASSVHSYGLTFVNMLPEYRFVSMDYRCITLIPINKWEDEKKRFRWGIRFPLQDNGEITEGFCQMVKEGTSRAIARYILESKEDPSQVADSLESVIKRFCINATSYHKGFGKDPRDSLIRAVEKAKRDRRATAVSIRRDEALVKNFIPFPFLIPPKNTGNFRRTDLVEDMIKLIDGVYVLKGEDEPHE